MKGRACMECKKIFGLQIEYKGNDKCVKCYYRVYRQGERRKRKALMKTFKELGLPGETYDEYLIRLGLK